MDLEFVEKLRIAGIILLGSAIIVLFGWLVQSGFAPEGGDGGEDD